MIVSNTSPIMNLAVVGRLNLLEQLYGKVFIPEAVSVELSATGLEQLGILGIQSLSWIEMRSVSNRLLVDSLLLELDAGESETIVLAMETKAELLLLDEHRGRKVASRLGLRFIGLLGVLVEAKHKGLIGAVEPVLNDLIVKAGFWIDKPLYTRVLREAGE